ncbi:Hypothetical predicted protein, partial [Podarcis lilfordi]
SYYKHVGLSFKTTSKILDCCRTRIIDSEAKHSEGLESATKWKGVERSTFRNKKPQDLQL